MKKLVFVVALTLAFLMSVSCGEKSKLIKTEVPPRPAGQEDVLQLRAPAIDTVRIGFVGLGGRGSFALYRYTQVPWTKIVALCDIVPEKVERNVTMLKNRGIEVTATYTGEEGYKEMCKRDDIDLVYIATNWQSHTPIALEAMNNGKHVAIEVPSATSLQECWDLINTSERTRKHCMMLENCCYDFFELSTLQMAREGVFGEILHVEGAYCHTLSPGWISGKDNWRLDFNSKHKGDIYPTHGLGPIAQVLNIHRGDRFKTLVAMETKSVKGVEAVKNCNYADTLCQNGDLTMTMITTEKGKTVLVEHDVMTPRPYDRMYQVVGSEGYASNSPIEQFSTDRDRAESLGVFDDETQLNNQIWHGPYPYAAAQKLKEKYPNPILNEDLEELAKRVGGHGGMDFLMDYRLIYCLHYGLPLDMDVYDLAEWCCLGELGEISIKNGNAPVEVPDFTRGAWNKIDGFKYAFADGSFK